MLLTGGNVALPQLGRRLQRELSALLAARPGAVSFPNPYNGACTGPELPRIPMASGSDLQCEAWVGSSILSSLSFCRTPEWGQWVTRAEYEAHGPRTLRAFVL